MEKQNDPLASSQELERQSARLEHLELEKRDAPWTWIWCRRNHLGKMYMQGICFLFHIIHYIYPRKKTIWINGCCCCFLLLLLLPPAAAAASCCCCCFLLLLLLPPPPPAAAAASSCCCCRWCKHFAEKENYSLGRLVWRWREIRAGDASRERECLQKAELMKHSSGSGC